SGAHSEGNWGQSRRSSIHRADGHSWWLKFDPDLNLLGGRYSNGVPLRGTYRPAAIRKTVSLKDLLPPAFGGKTRRLTGQRRTGEDEDLGHRGRINSGSVTQGRKISTRSV